MHPHTPDQIPIQEQTNGTSTRRARGFRFLPALAACAVAAAGQAAAYAQSYNWKSVNISGAGAMVTDVYAHPLQNGLLYIRTDVGGSYRWDAANTRWIPLNDRLTFSQSDYWCCEGFAIDPQNVNVVYYAGGITRYGRNGAIFKSSDKGNTWTQLTGINVLMDGNGDLRWADTRLVVSPFNSSVILFGSRSQGLWRSTNGGTNWTQITTLPNGASGYGVQSLAFDPGATGMVYAFVNINGGSSGGTVYASSDNGATWNAIGNGMAVRRMKVASDSALWCTTSTGVSIYAGGVWVHRQPAGSAVSFCAIGIHPTDPDNVIVAREKANGANSIIYRTANGGTSWTQQAYTVGSTATWSTPAFWNYRPTNFVFDPFNAATVWGDRWRTQSVNSGTVPWMQQEAGHEEDVCAAAIAPPSGTELLVGVYDDDGFAMNNGLDNYPTKKLDTTSGYNGHTWSMAYAESSPTTMIRLGYQAFYGGTISPFMKSTDGGTTWSRVTTFPANLFPLECAVSATNPSRFVVICNANYSSDTTGANWNPVTATSPWRYTFDGGATWNVVSGLPTPPSFYGPWGNNQFLASDHVNGSKFYYLDVDSATNLTTGKIYRSVSSGSTFAHSNPSSLLPVGKRWFILKTRPGTEGDVWACVDNYPSSGRTADEGLYRSTDSGVTWAKVSTVNRAFSFGFGKSSTSTPSLYVYGRVNSGTTDALFKSDDLGATWTNITSSSNNLSNFPSIIEGSRQTAGRVFVGTGGRGFFYGQPGTSSTTVSFQQGTASYAGAAYATIQASAPLTRLQDWRIYGFGIPGNSSHQAGLLQFNSIFGSGAGLIPSTGATITSATLELKITSTWGGNLNVYPMLKSWSPSTVTDSYRAYNGSSPTAYWGTGSSATVGPVSGVDFSATLGVSTPITGPVDSVMTVDVTNIVKQWQNGSVTNNGLALYGSSQFLGAAFYSPTYGISGPKLTVTYTSP